MESLGKSSIFLNFGSKPTDSALKLYCFAHAGGTASIYAPWSRLLSPEIEVCGVELPGHGSRMLQTPLTDVQSMAQDFIAHLPSADDRPFAFYGHSLGAIVAYEAALQLSRSTHPDMSGPVHLFTGAARAPHLPPVKPPLSHLKQAEFLQGVQARYGGIAAAVLAEPELLEMILPPMRTDFRAYEEYRHAGAGKLDCPITSFTGSRDSIVQEASVAAWCDHTTGPFRCYTVPGDHFFLAESRDRVLSILAQALQQNSPQLRRTASEGCAAGIAYSTID